MKLTISFLTINYKTKTRLIIMSEVLIKFKAWHFMLKLTGPFKMQGTDIMICKTICTMTISSWVGFYNNKNYIKIFSQNTKCDLLYLGFCAISLIRKHNQRVRMNLTFNNFNTFLVGINMFKVNKENTGTRCEICSKLTIKTPEKCQFAISIFKCEHILQLVLVLLKLTLNKQILVGLITGWQLATQKWFFSSDIF